MSVSDPSRDIPLPRSWPNHIKVGVVHAISIAHAAVVCSRGWAVNSSIERARLASELRASENEVSLLKEEIRIKDGRTGKMDPRKRPRYSPSDRMAILELKSARGWTIAETARIFQVEAETISSWMARLEFELPDKPRKQKKLRASSKRRKPRQHPLLKAFEFQNLLDAEMVNNQADLAKRYGISRARVTQYLNLLKLPDEIIDFLKANSDQEPLLRYFTERRLR